MKEETIEAKAQRISTLLGIEITPRKSDVPIHVTDYGRSEFDHTRPWTLEVSFSESSWFIALVHADTREIRAYLDALDMVGHRAAVTWEAK